MKDLLFQRNLREHKFAKAYRNNLQFRNFISSDINVSSNSVFRVPLIFLGDVFHKNRGKIMLADYLQFDGMKPTKDKMIELLNISPLPVRVHYGEHFYYIGKAFLARIEPDTGEIKYLLIGTYSREEPSKVENVTMWVASEVHSDKTNRPAQVIINLFLAEFKGDIIITPDILRYVGDRIDIPNFSTLDERQEHIDKIIDFSLKEFIKNGIIV